MNKLKNTEKSIKDILKGKTGDLKLYENIAYERKRYVKGHFYSYGKRTTEVETYTEYNSYISGKYIKVFISKKRILNAGFSGVRESDHLTARQKRRLEAERDLPKPKFFNMFKNYEAFRSKSYSAFKKSFKYKDLVKVVALLRLYNELFLQGDTKGCKAVNEAVKALQIE